MTTNTVDLNSTDELASVGMLQVFTAPQKIAAPMLAIEWKRRSTTANPVAEANRYRAIVVHESALAIGTDACASKFQVLLQRTIHDLASTMLAAELAETDKREVYASKYTVNGVLAYWSEEKRRQTIDKDAVIAWLKTSATFEALPSDAIRTTWLATLPKLAAPAYRQVLGQNAADKAARILSRFATEDAEHPVCVFLSERLSNIMTPDEEIQAEAF